MNALPLELRESICSYLFPPIDRVNAVSAPTSSEVERTAIYNLRLTSQRMKDATSFVFLKVIQDVPRQCTEQSLRHLGNLIHLTGDGSQITFLTFSSCKLSFTEQNSMSQVKDSAAERCKWIKTYLAQYLGSIFDITPSLRHLVCCFEAVCGSKVLEFGRRSMFALKNIVDEKIPDPIQYIFQALESTRLHETMETLGTFITSRECLPQFTSIQQREYFPLPSLKHMTYSSTYLYYSKVLIYCANITSWNIVLDERSIYQDFVPTHIKRSVSTDVHRIDMRKHRPSDAEAAAIQHHRICTITGNGCLVPHYLVTGIVYSMFNHVDTIPLLTICNMTMLDDPERNNRRFGKWKEISKLVFRDVKRSFQDYEGSNDPPTDPIRLNMSFLAFRYMCDSALSVNVWNEGKMEDLGYKGGFREPPAILPHWCDFIPTWRPEGSESEDSEDRETRRVLEAMSVEDDSQS